MEPTIKSKVVIIEARCGDSLAPKFKKIQAYLSGSIDAIRGRVIPHFSEFKFCKIKGVIRVTCDDEYSKLWIISQVNQVSSFEGLELHAREEVVPPPPQYICHAFLPGVFDMSARYLLLRIGKSTPKLRELERCNVRKINFIAGEEDEGGTMMELEIDRICLEHIKESGWWAYAGVSVVYFWSGFEGHPKVRFLPLNKYLTSQ